MRSALTPSERPEQPAKSSDPATYPAIAPLYSRWMIRRDLPEMLAIENHSFPYPWSEDDFIAILRDRNVIGRVVEHNEKIIAFIIYELGRDRFDVMNLAVHENFRRFGVGLYTVGWLIGRLTQNRRRSIWADVREENLQAQLFLRACGFRAVKTVKTYGNFPVDQPDRIAYRFLYGLTK